MDKKNIYFILSLLFLFLLSFDFISAACSPVFATRCSGNSVVRCSTSGEWVHFTSCFGSTPICSQGKCISRSDASNIIDNTDFAPGGNFIDLGNLFLDLIGKNIIGSQEGVKYDSLENGGRFTFTREDAFLNVQGSSFEGVLPKDSSGRSSFIEVNALGNITKADFAVGKNGGEYLIGEVKFKLPPNSRVYYDSENGFRFPEGTKITSLNNFYSLDKELNFEGKNLNFVNEIVVNGKLKLNKYGYVIGEGEATYEGMKIKNPLGENNVAILKNNLDKLKEEDLSKLNWIRKDSNGLEFSSSSTGSIFVEFLEGNDILNVGQYGKLNMNLRGGDKIKIENLLGVDSHITHTGVALGSTEIKNDGLSVFLITDQDGELRSSVDLSPITLSELSSSKYQAVQFTLESDKMDEEIRINSKGKLSGVLIDKVKGRDGKQIVEKVLYELKNPVIDLNYEELSGLVNILKENIKDTNTADYVFQSSQFFLQEAKSSKFTTSQSLSLTKEIIALSGKDSHEALLGVSDGLRLLSESGKTINPQQFSEFTISNLKNVEKNNLGWYKIQSSYFILEKGLENSKDFGTIKDFTTKVLQSKSNSYDISFFGDAIKEYNGANFKEIEQGVELMSKYYVDSRITEFLDIKYSNIKDKQSLGKEYASAVNSYFRDKKNINSDFSKMASINLDQMHLEEFGRENSDLIRDAVISNLDSNSIYYLISNSDGNGNLFTSSFEKMYSKLKTSEITNIMKSSDSEGKYWLRFTTELSARGKFSEAYKENPVFYRNILYESLNNPDENILFENFVLMGKTLQEIYENPKEYPGERENFEEFLVSKYKKSNTESKKGAYAYLLALNKNPVNKDAKSIVSKIPTVHDAILPSSFSQRSEIAAKLYFYNDENWFSIATNDFNSNYKMDLEWNNGKQARLSKIVNGKKVIIDLELNDVKESFAPSIEEDIKGQTYLYTAHRGHSFNTEKTYPDFLSSDTPKIVHLAGCGSYGRLAEYQQKFPNSYIIADQNTGEGFVSDEVTLFILEKIAEGKLNWKDLTPDFATEKDLVFPEKESLQQYIQRYGLEM